ncbi:MAG: uncharacterized protein QG612_1621 [Pseudomonadota bacterium]|nr:uncharacterized protein [Pseudomonadota bacterium]
MNHAVPPSVPPDAAELAALQSFLAGLPAGAMTLERLDGFFCALHCAVSPPGPSVWLAQVWGESAESQASFDDEGQARAIVGTLMKLHEAIGAALERGGRGGASHAPRIAERADGLPGGNDWASGFVLGMQIAPEGWQPLLADDEAGQALVPIMMLHHEHDEDEALRPPPIDAAMRAELRAVLTDALLQLHQQLAPERRQVQRGERQALTFRRTGAKVGRNDPCPCGSGRKYKACCALQAG